MISNKQNKYKLAVLVRYKNKIQQSPIAQLCKRSVKCKFRMITHKEIKYSAKLYQTFQKLGCPLVEN